MSKNKIRFIKSINHETPDRVPMDLGATTMSTIEINLYNDLRNFLNLPKSDIKPYNPFFGLVEPEEDMAEYLGLDFKRIGPEAFKVTKINNNKYIDELGIIWKKNGLNLEIAESPIKILSNETISKMKLPCFNDWDRIANIKAKANKDLKSKYVLVGDVWCTCIIVLALRLLGYAEFLEYTLSNKLMIWKLLEKLTGFFNEFTDGFLSRVGSFIEVVAVGDDLGAQQNLLFSPKTYRELIKPFHKSIIENIKKHTEAKIMWHTCGSVYDLIPDLIDIGVDILNPIQTTANRMDPCELKKSFGKDLVFWGGLDAQNLLVLGNKEKVNLEAKKLVKTLGSNGGYIFSGSHNLIGNIKPENIVEAFLTAKNIDFT
jgi:uroporphyrinogen decarboxylase